MAEGWYYSDGGQRKGPVSLDAIRALTDARIVDAETLVWREGMVDWEPAYRHISGMVPPLPGSSDARQVRADGPAGSSRRDYNEPIGIGEATRRFFGNYATFSGRANRGEYWWWTLAGFLIALALAIVDASVFGTPPGEAGPLSGVWSLIIFIPSLAIGARRLHDTDRSGWWLLAPSVLIVAATALSVPELGLGATPATLLVVQALAFVSLLMLLVWLSQRGTAGPNRFG